VLNCLVSMRREKRGRSQYPKKNFVGGEEGEKEEGGSKEKKKEKTYGAIFMFYGRKGGGEKKKGGAAICCLPFEKGKREEGRKLVERKGGEDLVHNQP